MLLNGDNSPLIAPLEFLLYTLSLYVHIHGQILTHIYVHVGWAREEMHLDLSMIEAVCTAFHKPQNCKHMNSDRLTLEA